MFCTMDEDVFEMGHYYVIAVVENEIDAVHAFRTHLDDHSRTHAPYVHMERDRPEWTLDAGDQPWARDIELARDRNLFRVPPNLAESALATVAENMR